MKSVIRNIIAVYVAEASGLSGMILSSLGKVTLPQELRWTPVIIEVPARLTINNKVEDKDMAWQSTLVFRTCEDISTRGHKVYRVSMADGTQLLIGSDQRPYPVTTVTSSLPDNMTDTQLNEVTVTLTSVQKPPQIA